MQATTDPVAVALLEHDPSGARLSWVFPAQGELPPAVLAARAQLSGAAALASPTFAWSRWKSLWYYSLARERKAADQPDVVHAAVSRFAIVLASPLFDPERHHALLQVLLAAFEAEGGSPLALLQRVLSVSTKGSAAAPAAKDFVASRFDASAARLACPFGATLRLLGAEGAATLWAAVLLRARVCVYHDGGVAPVLALVRCLPLLAWHRARWENSLRGLCELSEPEEVAELQAAGSLAAGFADAAILEKPELYDVLVDARSGKASSTSTGGTASITLKLTASGAALKPPPAVARAVAKALDAVPAGAPERDLVDALAAKTGELLDKAAEVATTTTGDDADADAGLPEGVAAFLRRVHASEELGAGA